MFSGIVAGKFKVASLVERAEGVRLQTELPLSLVDGLKKGASVSVNGACLTAVEIVQSQEDFCLVSFDVVQETLRRTNLGTLKAGSEVNIERSLKYGDEIGGHLCSGHVDGVCRVSKTELISGSKEIDFSVPPELAKFFFEKGFIALNGVSLTIAKKSQNIVRVAFIPETLRQTNLGNLEVGQSVNFEIDRATQSIVETVERVLKERNS